MSGSARGVKFFYKAEYCDTLQSKEKRNWEHKACLNDRALRLLDHGFSKNSSILQLMTMEAVLVVPCYCSMASV